METGHTGAGGFILDGPAQLAEAVRLSEGLPVCPKKPDHAMLLGMGGSALAGGIVDLLRIRQRCRWRWDVVRDYALPCRPGQRTLVFALSWSGETEETVAALRSAAASGATVVAVSRDGTLRKVAAQLGIPWVGVPARPPGFQPRFALYFMFGLLYEGLCRAGLLEQEESLEDLAAFLSSPECIRLEDAEGIARFVGDSVPVVYTPAEYESAVARTWRIKINENAKAPCLAGCLPEANHNEMLAWLRAPPGRFAFLLMHDPWGHPRVLRRFAVLGEMLAEAGHPVRSVPLAGATPLRRCLASLHLADRVTFHMARMKGVDPAEIPEIQEFKRRIRGADPPDSLPA